MAEGHIVTALITKRAELTQLIGSDKTGQALQLAPPAPRSRDETTDYTI